MTGLARMVLIMDDRARALLSDALQLPGPEREEFIESLLDAIEAEDFALTAEQEREIERRAEDVAKGRNIGRDLDEVIGELEARASARRTS